MGNFLVVISSRDNETKAERLYRSGLESIQTLKHPGLAHTVESPRVRAVSFPRLNGSGQTIVRDAARDAWILAIGTWFHSEGYGSGEESRLLARYLASSPQQLGRELEGFFVLVIDDARTGETHVLTDTMGSCHAYTRAWPRLTAISSSSLVLASLESFHLDETGCQEYLQGGVSYEDRTIYREVRKIAQATWQRYADGEKQAEQRYWRLSNLAPDSIEGARAVDALWDSLTRAAKNISRVFPRIACDLTGGYDSRALAAAFLASDSPFTTVVSGPDDLRDVVVSHGLAETAGLPHLHVALAKRASIELVREAHALTDGEFDAVEYAQILHVHRQLLERFDISINGSYGGIARALWWEVLSPRIGVKSRLDAVKVARARYATGAFDGNLFASGLRIDLPAHLAGVVARASAEVSDFPNTFQMDSVSLAMRIHRWQGRIASSTNQLWPCLSPFGLRTVLENLLQTSSALRQRSMLVRRLLAQYSPKLAAYPLAQGYPAMPVNWTNFYRFWPAATDLGRRGFNRLAHKISRGGGSRTAGHSGAMPARLQLWANEEVRDLLNPAHMRLRDLLDYVTLDGFIARSRQERFPYGAQWGRLLSIELSLRSLQTAARQRARE